MPANASDRSEPRSSTSPPPVECPSQGAPDPGRLQALVRFGARYAPAMVGGGVVMVVFILLLLPVAVMLGGAIWSALMGFLLSENACDEPEAEAA